MLLTALMVVTLTSLAVCAPDKSPTRSGGSPASPGRPDNPALQPEDPDLIGSDYPADRDKRAYNYVSEYKRLPVYNFGLGKRSPRYSFGLGKRSVDDYETFEMDPDQREMLAEFIDGYEPDYEEFDEIKRGREYSFGLGKRYSLSEEDKRNPKVSGMGGRRQMYDFGLGKREALKSYSFGLGKRLSPGKFNFGLGKRERNVNRFNFGLGKRSLISEEENV